LAIARFSERQPLTQVIAALAKIVDFCFIAIDLQVEPFKNLNRNIASLLRFRAACGQNGNVVTVPHKA
jgi:hypothetical protein